MNETGASDLYMTVGYPPALRIENKIVPIDGVPLDPPAVHDIMNAVLTGRQLREFETAQELNSALDIGEYGRFRVNVLRQRQHAALVIRRIVSKIPDFETLRLPRILKDLVMEPRGLVLISGMTGSGKSTTLASMIDYRNENTTGHIITIEDPIEFYHEHRGCIVTQREVGVDTESYAVAMKNALRQRPDVILVGEARDREVMEQALTIAETGHLCLATLHTSNAYQAIERIVNLFPEDMYPQVRMNLSMNLRAIVSQRLVRSVDGKMALALEIMLNQGLVRELIEKGEVGKIKDVMEQNITSGMCTFDHSLAMLWREGIISEGMAVSQADKSGDMKLRLQRIKHGTDHALFDMMDTSLLSISESE